MSGAPTPPADVLVEQRHRLAAIQYRQAYRDYDRGAAGQGFPDLSEAFARFERDLLASRPAGPVGEDALKHIRANFQKWLDDGPEAQPRYKNGIRPWSNGDLKWLISGLDAALSPAPSADDGWQPIETAPHACHVLGSRFDEDTGDWLYAVVASPPIYPFTHWRPLPATPATVQAEQFHRDTLRQHLQLNGILPADAASSADEIIELIESKREKLLELCAESGVTDVRAAVDMAWEHLATAIRKLKGTSDDR